MSQTVGPMTSRERVLAALRREPVDRTPVVNPTSVATVELMDLVDAPFPEANREPELMARLAATGHTELGFDSVMPVFSIIQESSAIGCKIQWEQKDNWPTVKMREPIYETPDDIAVPDDLLEHPDTHCVARGDQDPARAVRRRSRDHRQDDGAVVAGLPLLRRRAVPAPVARRPRADEADVSTGSKRLTIEFGLAQIEAGADALTLPDHATGDLVSGEYYHRYLQDMHHRVRRADSRPDHPPHLRQDRRPDGLHRADRDGGVPLRLEERAGRVDGDRRRPDQPRRQRQQPRDAVREGPGRGEAGGLQEPRGGRADGRARVRDPAADADREPEGDPRGGAGVARRRNCTPTTSQTRNRWPNSPTSRTTSSGRRSTSSSSGPTSASGSINLFAGVAADAAGRSQPR